MRREHILLCPCTEPGCTDVARYMRELWAVWQAAHTPLDRQYAEGLEAWRVNSRTQAERIEQLEKELAALKRRLQVHLPRPERCAHGVYWMHWCGQCENEAKEKQT